MPSTIELEAKNVEQAVKTACEQLNLPPEKLKYDIISYGSSGVFGIGKIKNAKIRVKLPPKSDSTIASVTESDNSVTRVESVDEVQAHVQKTAKESVTELSQPSVYSKESLELARSVLQQIVNFISEESEIVVETGNNPVLFNIKGGNSAVLIGKHGQTLEAIQTIIEKIINKTNTERVRVQVDVEGYVENRRNNMIRHAERMAQKCKRICKPVTVGFMNAHDRRIVHLALKNDHDVRTHSTGDGIVKKMMIYPKKNDSQQRNTPS